MTPSKALLLFCISFIGGVFIASFWQVAAAALLAAAAFGIFLISVFWNREKIVVAGFCVLFLVVGVWRYQTAELKAANDELRRYNDSNETITLIGVVTKEPDIREKSVKLTVKIEGIVERPEVGPRDSNVLVTTWRYPEYQYGDKLKITGKLESPPAFEDFNHRDYLKKDGIYSVMSWPEIEVVDTGSVNPIMKTLFGFKNKFKETARQFISPPQVGILEALIFGDEENISREWKDKLNLTGTRHITAVSGMNITIISFLILNFLLLLGFWRQQAFYLTIFLLILYILIIGAPASAVRAGVMGGILLLAQYLGRMSAAQRAVVFAATFMLFLNPLLLRLDVGFQLSFLAVLGIIHFQPFFAELFRKIPNPQFFPVRTTLSATLGAQIFTLPILVYNFGYIPLTSPLTNILIVPLLAPLTILIFAFVLSAMIFSFFGWILFWPTWLLLTYLTTVIGLFAKLPFTSLTLENVSWIWLVVSYLILVLAAHKLQERQRLKFLQY